MIVAAAAALLVAASTAGLAAALPAAVPDAAAAGTLRNTAEFAAAAATSESCIKNVMYIVFENQNQATVESNAYFGTTLRNKGYYLKKMAAETHPSQPNYIAMVAGDTLGVTGDGNVNLAQTSIADLLDAKGITWKAYQEDYSTSGCNTAATIGRYARKHNPFMSFTSISKNATRCAAHIVNSAQLDTDAAAGKLPQYMFFTPNLDDDAHDTDVPTAATWLKAFLEPKLTSAAYKNTLFFVTFDETASFTAVGPIYTVLVGAGIQGAGVSDSTAYTHYSFLKSVEGLFGLGSLGRKDASATAVPIGPLCA
ncbi:phosphoesterase family-domain-containing protein [Zopfochytrium polystomum]|nr:phosphoesterase family-domain-containing protein [Zopfochytrium polystomum]